MDSLERIATALERIVANLESQHAGTTIQIKADEPLTTERAKSIRASLVRLYRQENIRTQ